MAEGSREDGRGGDEGDIQLQHTGHAPMDSTMETSTSGGDRRDNERGASGDVDSMLCGNDNGNMEVERQQSSSGGTPESDTGSCDRGAKEGSERGDDQVPQQPLPTDAEITWENPSCRRSEQEMETRQGRRAGAGGRTRSQRREWRNHSGTQRSQREGDEQELIRWKHRSEWVLEFNATSKLERGSVTQYTSPYYYYYFTSGTDSATSGTVYAERCMIKGLPVRVAALYRRLPASYRRSAAALKSPPHRFLPALHQVQNNTPAN
jgi:hypothetical protein